MFRSIPFYLLKDAEPAIASTPDPAKTKNLLRLNRELLELYASRGRAITAFTNRKAALGLNEARREMLTRNEAYHRARLVSEKILDDAYRAADQLVVDATTDADVKLR